MRMPIYSERHQHLNSIRRAATAAASVERIVGGALHLHSTVLAVGGRRFALGHSSHLFIIGLGKAAPGMCHAAAAILGERLTGGIAAVPRAFSESAPPRLTYIQAGHPLPDRGSLAAARSAVSLLSASQPGDLVLALISGGGSAMFELPAAGVSLKDLQVTTRLLLHSGAPIAEVNTVRAALSQVKGGGLARMAAPARCLGLIVSDVVGDRLSAVASGPTVLRRAARERARQILRTHRLRERTPASVRAALRRASVVRSCPRPFNWLLASNRTMVDGARRQAEALGFSTRVVTCSLHGEARQVGQSVARKLRGARPGECLLLSGETTVLVQGPGRGGRNQELALSAALALAGERGLALMSFASDGVDGPTDAAGAIVDGESAAIWRQAGIDAGAALDRNDSYPLLDSVGALIRCGPTGTNLADLVVGLKYAE